MDMDWKSTILVDQKPRSKRKHVVRNRDSRSVVLVMVCTVPWVLETCFWCTWGVPPSSTMHDYTWPLKTMVLFFIPKTQNIVLPIWASCGHVSDLNTYIRMVNSNVFFVKNGQ